MKRNIYTVILQVVLLCVLLASCNHVYMAKNDALSIDASVIEMALGAGARFGEAWIPITSSTGAHGIKYAEDLKDKAEYASEMSWSVEDPSVVTVDKEGKLVARKLGQTSVSMKMPSGKFSHTKVIVRRVYGLSFKTGKGSGVVPETVYVREGQSFVLPRGAKMTPPAKGMVIDAWDYKGSQFQPDEKLLNIREDMVFTALWELKKCIVHLSGGTVGDDALRGARSYFVVAGRRMAQPPEPITDKDYIHSGAWVRKSTGELWDFAKDKVYDDMTLVATWLPRQTVVLLPGGATGDDGYGHGKQYREYTVPAPIGLIPPAHMEFDKWVDYGVTPPKSYQIGDVIQVEDKLIQLTATWKPIKREVAFDANGASGSFGPLFENEASSYVLPPGDTFAAPDGMEFDDWQIGYDVYKPGDTFIIPDAHTTIKPRWKKKMISVSFAPGIASGSMEPVELWIKDSYGSYAHEFIPPYHQLFDGWKYAGKVYKDSANIPVQGKDILLEATWRYDMIDAVDHDIERGNTVDHSGETNCIRKLVLEAVEEGGSEVDLGYIRTHKLTRLREVFAANLADDPLNLMTNFNGDVSKWDVSQVFDAQNLFRGARKFTQDLSHWQMPKLRYMASAYHGTSFVPLKRDGSASDSSGYAKMPAPIEQRYKDYDKTDKQPKDSSELRAITDAAPGSANYVDDLNTVDTSLMQTMSNIVNSSFNRDIGDWDTSNVVFMNDIFRNATAFNQNINYWNTNKLQMLPTAFLNARSFNQDLDLWSTRFVRSFRQMFQGAHAFNGKVNTWDISAARDLQQMFYGARSFNQPVNRWRFGKPSYVYEMFREAKSFNQPVNEWGESMRYVPDLVGFFWDATSFNQDLDKWEIPLVNSTDYMFAGATSFNGSLANWDTSAVTSMYQMFKNATSFNQPINHFDTSQVVNMQETFKNAASFNQPLDAWDVSKVDTMLMMFEDTAEFNQDISMWEIDSCQNIRRMFKGTKKFNQPLNAWGEHTKNVSNMAATFWEAQAFNQPIDQWNVSNVVRLEWLFASAPAFNQDLTAWNSKLRQNVFKEAYDEKASSWQASYKPTFP